MLESELFLLLEGTADAAFTLSDEGQICSWNKAAERLFGYSKADALQKTCYQLLEGQGPLGTPVCHKHCTVVECAGNDTDIPNFDMRVKTASGQRIWINMSTIIFRNPPDGKAPARSLSSQHFRPEEDRGTCPQDARPLAGIDRRW